jgi:hypothetical protein
LRSEGGGGYGASVGAALDSACNGYVGVQTDPGHVASGVEQTRPLSTYPTSARYTGTGSTSDAANFVCK